MVHKKKELKLSGNLRMLVWLSALFHHVTYNVQAFYFSSDDFQLCVYLQQNKKGRKPRVQSDDDDFITAE